MTLGGFIGYCSGSNNSALNTPPRLIYLNICNVKEYYPEVGIQAMKMKKK